MLTLCAVQFVDVMGVTVVVTALPQMVRDLHGGRAGGTAVVTAYAMAFGGLLMLASRVGDRYGHRRVLLWSVIAFSIASLVAALAGSIVVLAAGPGGPGRCRCRPRPGGPAPAASRASRHGRT
jgi:MFS family permease